MATTEDTPALEAAADCEPVTLPVPTAEQLLEGVRYWLETIAGQAKLAAASNLCDEWHRGKFNRIADYAERGIREHAQINARLIRKALGGD